MIADAKIARFAQTLSRRRRTATFLVVAALVTATFAPALAEIRTVERSARAQPGKDVRIGVSINVRSDCTSGPLPAIRLEAQCLRMVPVSC